MLILLLAIVAPQDDGAWSTARPEALLRLQASIDQLRTAEIALKHQLVIREINGDTTHLRVRNVIARIAGDELLWEDHGDDQGVMMRTEDGTPSPLPQYQLPLMELRRADGHWSHWMGEVEARHTADFTYLHHPLAIAVAGITREPPSSAIWVLNRKSTEAPLFANAVARTACCLQNAHRRPRAELLD